MFAFFLRKKLYYLQAKRVNRMLVSKTFIGQSQNAEKKKDSKEPEVKVAPEKPAEATSSDESLSKLKDSEKEKEVRDKVTHLYEYIRELNKLRSKNITDFYRENSYEWKLVLSDIPVVSKWVSSYDPSVEYNPSRPILSIRKPDLHRDLPKCPEPDASFKKLLNEKYDEATFCGELLKSDLEDLEKVANDNVKLTKAYNQWLDRRKKWVDCYKELKKIEQFFLMLYREYAQLDKMSDSIELVVADGFVYDQNDPEFHHPILSHKVRIEYLHDSDTIQIVNTDDNSEIEESFLRGIKGGEFVGFSDLKDEFLAKDIHPLDRKESEKCIRSLVTSVCANNLFIGDGRRDFSSYENRLLVYMQPVLYIRKKQDGIPNAVNMILADLENGGNVPAYLAEIVSGGKKSVDETETERSLEAKLAAVGGEDVDILLSKEANNEQLKIAQRIEKYNAVLVQGPPGTGKTHTIANLLGHFLAQGKTVLVTSHTRKALSVMKAKVVSNLQNLCVSIIDDSKEDMERSVDGITEYMASHTSEALRREKDKIAEERKQIITNLAETRKYIYTLIKKESDLIDVCGESLSPSQIASFVVDNAEPLSSYIPGKMTSEAAFPLTEEDLHALYLTNKEISVQDEQELSRSLPSLEELPSLDKYGTMLHSLEQGKVKISAFENKFGCKVSRTYGSPSISVKGSAKFKDFSFTKPSMGALDIVKRKCSVLDPMKKWQIAAAVDGKQGGALRGQWFVLIELIKQTNEKCEKYIAASFTKKIEISKSCAELKPALEIILQDYKEKGKICFIKKLINKNYRLVFGNVLIDGRKLENIEGCELLNLYLEYDLACQKCGVYWNKLVAQYGDEPEFENLDSRLPVKVALEMIPKIEDSLAWNDKSLQSLVKALDTANLPLDSFIDVKGFFDAKYINAILGLKSVISSVVEIISLSINLANDEQNVQELKTMLARDKRKNSPACQDMIRAIDGKDIECYAKAYEQLKNILDKRDVLLRRNACLLKIGRVAPEWANAIRAREGVHGEGNPPSLIRDAWKWKQCSIIIENMVRESYEGLQQRCVELGRMYRQKTAQYAEKSAWYHLLRKVEGDTDLQQSLEGWKKITKKIGKGTGKNAPRYRAEARMLMAKCQAAVPAWIMPMGKVFESLVPGKNIFDIIIIDEASQADVSALAMLYMGKKTIIVGDDQQVSPMAIGVNVDQCNNLLDTYLKKNGIPNSDLYDLNGSVYDIASTTFRPLMLREHFRCVPEIIGFSNELSYDGKIKPMRDGSNNKLLPAVVNLHVKDGLRQSKYNKVEALNIVALMKACMDLPEYSDKTFGVISLLGNEQVDKVISFAYKYIDTSLLEKHRFLCGDASNFQGDERDVIFLSLVDSPKEEGTPLTIATSGKDDSTKKRYNVAASRARDQMWVVHSLDPARDLKMGDLRKRLIDYAQEPVASVSACGKEDELSEFEANVARDLTNRGYSISVRYPVGAYRLDMVIRHGTQGVALECDGDSLGGDDDEICETMERQAILERIGWRFIRVRGCEYFRNRSATVDHIVEKLNAFGIFPEENSLAQNTLTPSTSSMDLLNRVKDRADAYLEKWAKSEIS